MPTPTIVHALGNGNCAYNAFFLGLCDLIIQGKLDDDKNRQAKILSFFKDSGLEQSDWQNLKLFLLSKKTSDELNSLQQQIAANLRALSLTVLESDENYALHTQEALKASYDVGEGDDIFRRHEFIIKKFKELKNEAELENWWQIEGYKQFLAEMKKNGVYAGDMELAALAKYFDMEVFAVRRNDMKTPLVQNKDKKSNLPAMTLRNENIHWDYEADDFPKWLDALVEKEKSLKFSTEKPDTKPKPAYFDQKVPNLKKIEETLPKTIKIKKEKQNVALVTSKHDEETLRELVKSVIEAIKAHGLDPKKTDVEMQAPEKDKAFLIEECKMQGITLKNAEEKNIPVFGS